jgi:hypothetical protein
MQPPFSKVEPLYHRSSRLLHQVVKAMPTFKDDGEITSLFLFNQIIARLGILRDIVTDHGSHFQNKMMTELTSNLGLWKEHSSPYYPQANGQVEAVNKSLKTILQQMINSAKSNWHLMLYSALWAYQTFVKTATSFSPFQLVYGLEAVFPIECQIPSLKLAVQLFQTLHHLKSGYYTSNNSMNNIVMWPCLMRLTRKNSSVSIIGSFILGFFLKVTFSWSMTKIRTPWG